MSPVDPDFDAPIKTNEGWKAWAERYAQNDLSIWSSDAFKAPKVYKPKVKPRRASSWRDHTYWFIGDVHGNFAEYQKAIADIRAIDSTAITVQVGDLELSKPSQLKKLNKLDGFIQGNHDDIHACLKHPNFLGKFGYKNGMFFAGGASSSKFGFRNEEMTDFELAQAIELYTKVKPEIVVTHCQPTSIQEYINPLHKASRTTDALEEMWQIHNPHVWACGHYHSSYDEVIDGCDFIQCAPLQSRQVRLGWIKGVDQRQKASQPIEMTAGKVVKSLISKLF